MSGEENLPYWSRGQLAPEQERNLDAQYQAYNENRHRESAPAPAGGGGSGMGRVVGFALLGLLAALALAGFGYWLADSSSDGVDAGADSSTLSAEPADAATEQELAGATAVDETADGSTDDSADGSADDSADGSADDTAANGAEDTEQEASDDGTATTDGSADGEGAAGDDGSSAATDADLFFPPGAERPDRYAVFDSGKLYLLGRVPSQEVADLITSKAGAVVGPGNVVTEYEIDPTVVIEENSSAPLFVKDVVLFEFNSTEVASAFFPLLDLGVVLLSQNPQATMTVVTHTDSVGSAEVNLDVARRRAEAVKLYMTRKGADGDQIKLDPRGEAQADASPDTPEAIQRRAEFVITGLIS